MEERKLENMLIRPKTEEDQNQIKEIIDTSFGNYIHHFARSGLDSEGEILVCQVNKKTVGYVKLRSFNLKNQTCGVIFWLAVHPDYRKNGIASQLVSSGTKYLKEKNAKLIFAPTNQNAATLTCFKREKYKKIIFPGLWKLFRWNTIRFYLKSWLMLRKVTVIHM